MSDVHSCSYYCDRPECVKAQRDEFRERLLQREWQGLTDEEIEDLYFDRFSMGELDAFARAIEAKLKEKNT